MKKNHIVLLLASLLLIGFSTCKKDAKVNSQTFKIENEKVEAETQSVKITGTYVYSGTIDGIL